VEANQRPGRETAILIPGLSILTSFELGGGIADNMYFAPANTRAGAFLDAEAGVESSVAPSRDSAAHFALRADGRYYPGEPDANETTVEVLADFRYAAVVPAVGVTGSLVYDDYQLFDENADPLPQGDSRSLANEIRAAGFYSTESGHAVEAGVLFQRKDYMMLEFDYRERGADLAGSWQFSDNLAGELSCRYGLRSYDHLRSAGADGIVLDSNPLVEEDVAGVEGGILRRLPRSGSAGLYAQHVVVRDRFQGEGSYAESGGGVHTSIAVGKQWAIGVDAEMYWRRYARRQVPQTGVAQADRLGAVDIMVERAIHKAIAVYAQATRNARDSNDYALGYTVNTVSFGVRGML